MHHRWCLGGYPCWRPAPPPAGNGSLLPGRLPDASTELPGHALWTPGWTVNRQRDVTCKLHAGVAVMRPITHVTRCDDVKPFSWAMPTRRSREKPMAMTRARADRDGRLKNLLRNRHLPTPVLPCAPHPPRAARPGLLARGNRPARHGAGLRWRSKEKRGRPLQVAPFRERSRSVHPIRTWRSGPRSSGGPARRRSTGRCSPGCWASTDAAAGRSGSRCRRGSTGSA